MYYLDLFQLHKSTKKVDRISIRESLDRDVEMAYKLKLQRNICYYCGCDIDMSGHLDHKIPIYYGGTNNSSNLVASCKECNLAKSTGQIEITNPYTINDYKKLIVARERYYVQRARRISEGKRPKQMSKRAQLYGTYKANLFKEV